MFACLFVSAVLMCLVWTDLAIFLFVCFFVFANHLVNSVRIISLMIEDTLRMKMKICHLNLSMKWKFAVCIFSSQDELLVEPYV